METFWETHKTSLVAVAVALVAALSTCETGAGIVFRIPFYERVERIDKRVLAVDMEPQTVLSTDQLRLNVDAYARYRIIDPVKMVQTAGTLQTVDSQLAQILSSVVRQELGRRSFAALLAAERGSTMANIRTKLDAQARKYGAQVIDVRIKRADLPDGTPLESAFRRMQSARQQEAATLRAQGQKNGQIIRAEAEAQAAKIYAEAYGKDPQFYDFYRAMQSYDTDGGTPHVQSRLSPARVNPPPGTTDVFSAEAPALPPNERKQRIRCA
jgi:membrane protease subunit HflC